MNAAPAAAAARFDSVLGASRGPATTARLHNPRPAPAAHDRLAELLRHVDTHAHVFDAAPGQHPLLPVAEALYDAGEQAPRLPLTARLAARTAQRLIQHTAEAMSASAERFALVCALTADGPPDFEPAARRHASAGLLARLSPCVERAHDPRSLLRAWMLDAPQDAYRAALADHATQRSRQDIVAVARRALNTHGFADVSRAVSKHGRELDRTLLSNDAWATLHAPFLPCRDDERTYEGPSTTTLSLNLLRLGQDRGRFGEALAKALRDAASEHPAA